MALHLLAVGNGGALGACTRYLISLLPWKGSFPMLTFATNLLGAFFIGLLLGFGKPLDGHKTMTLLLKTGFCGGFTTFSTFSLESYQLLVQGAFATALLYMGMSVILCIVGVALGVWCSHKSMGI